MITRKEKEKEDGKLVLEQVLKLDARTSRGNVDFNIFFALPSPSASSIGIYMGLGLTEIRLGYLLYLQRLWRDYTDCILDINDERASTNY